RRDRRPAVPAAAAQHKPGHDGHVVACPDLVPARGARAARPHDGAPRGHPVDHDVEERPHDEAEKTREGCKSERHLAAQLVRGVDLARVALRPLRVRPVREVGRGGVLQARVVAVVLVVTLARVAGLAYRTAAALRDRATYPDRAVRGSPPTLVEVLDREGVLEGLDRPLDLDAARRLVE